MISSFLLLLLPVAAVSGWFAARTGRSYPTKTNDISMVPRDYLVGLNFLLEEQPDKAVDVFIKMLEVDSDTVETHLALGSLFRRRGEVDRAIRIHQNLIARPHLDKQQRIDALLALGQDYMRAGVLDRAERIFLEVVDGAEQTMLSLKYLIDIYQQEKAWQQAIVIVKKYAAVTKVSMNATIAHYYCELALEERMSSNYEQARKYLRKAISTDSRCVRASLISGDLDRLEGRYKTAIKYYKQVKIQNANYLSEVIYPLIKCYEAINGEAEFIAYLNECLNEHARITVALALADKINKHEGTAKAIEFIAEYLKQVPSIRGLKRLIEYQALLADGKAMENLHLLDDLTASMLVDKPIYRCENCGFDGKSLHWLCPQCKKWNTIKPIHGLEGD